MTGSQSTVDKFRRAVEEHDFAAVDRLLAPDIHFHNPMRLAPFVGAEVVRGLLRVLQREFARFRYVGQFQGSTWTEGGTSVEAHALVFRAVVKGKQVHGVDILHVDDNDRISTFTVMIRPLSGLTAVGEVVHAGLEEAGLATTRQRLTDS